MTDLEALQELLEKVKSGSHNSVLDTVVMMHSNSLGFRMPSKAQRIMNSYNGSLDAAKALHDAILDDYLFLVGGNWVEVWLPFGGDIHKYHARNDIPARAWLMAILSALIAQETAHD